MQCAMTQNHDRANDWHGCPCTVRINRIRYGREERVDLTYLNTEKLWPVRSAAIGFAEQNFRDCGPFRP